MAKDAAGDGGAPRSVKGAIAAAARGLRIATRHDRRVPGARGLAAVAGRVPTAGRARVALRACDAGGTLRRRGELPWEIVVALGMHGIPRYGRTALGQPVRGRREGGTSRRERHMAAQCVTNRVWAAPGAVRAVPGDSVGAAFSTVYRRVRAVCRRAGVRPTPLVDREFFTTGAVGRPGGTGVRWAMLCPNRPRAAKPLHEYAAEAARLGAGGSPAGAGGWRRTPCSSRKGAGRRARATRRRTSRLRLAARRLTSSRCTRAGGGSRSTDPKCGDPVAA